MQVSKQGLGLAAHMYVRGLEANHANFVAMSPISFIERAALVYPNKVAVVHGQLRQTWVRPLHAPVGWRLPCIEKALA